MRYRISEQLGLMDQLHELICRLDNVILAMVQCKKFKIILAAFRGYARYPAGSVNFYHNKQLPMC